MNQKIQNAMMLSAITLSLIMDHTLQLSPCNFPLGSKPVWLDFHRIFPRLSTGGKKKINHNNMTSQYIISTSLQLLPMFTSQTVPNFFHLSLLKELPQFGHDDAYMMSEDNFLVPSKKSDY